MRILRRESKDLEITPPHPSVDNQSIGHRLWGLAAARTLSDKTLGTSSHTPKQWRKRDQPEPTNLADCQSAHGLQMPDRRRPTQGYAVRRIGHEPPTS